MTDMNEEKKLTPKQQRFVEEYLVDLNATQAAIRAGYAKSSSRVQGVRLITNANVSEAIREAQEARRERTVYSEELVLQKLQALGDDEEISGAARVTAWTNIGKHHGMFVERSENTNFDYAIGGEPEPDADEWEAEQTTH